MQFLQKEKSVGLFLKKENDKKGPLKTLQNYFLYNLKTLYISKNI
jgi:hypothetical protein